ncbi:hypothetical protein BJF79_03765 [Actinomadura sp. CNU-125]|uniref:hypothetical protein n=1 Tax=Actinomadura sp. CNU-125 TaxID=1904961 RepID=UPI00095CD70C|nr:hypothetical protein [Actinomadura sp. CNU-125]OLT13027.1 hypothetical protein BJF79_03765 [Actinomadura sp. CNU-125]
MALTFTYYSHNSDIIASELNATYDPSNGNAVSTVHVDNNWPTDGGFILIRQFSVTDPERPADWEDPTGLGNVVYGPLTAAADALTDFDVSALGLVFAFDSPYYGDEYLTASGEGSLLAGGEIQLQLRE